MKQFESIDDVYVYYADKIRNAQTAAPRGLLIKELIGEGFEIKDPRKRILGNGDCTLNNIVVSNGSFYLIDFDNYRLGFPEEDFANLLNSILYSTADSEVKSEAMQSARSYFHGIENSDEFVYKVKLCMQKNASRELYKHKENYRYLRRTPGTVQYLQGLLDIIYRVEESDFIL